jgi:hypothetical protein
MQGRGRRLTHCDNNGTRATAVILPEHNIHRFCSMIGAQSKFQVAHSSQSDKCRTPIRCTESNRRSCQWRAKASKQAATANSIVP